MHRRRALTAEMGTLRSWFTYVPTLDILKDCGGRQSGLITTPMRAKACSCFRAFARSNERNSQPGHQIVRRVQAICSFA
jgi:hypothetical protein